MCRHLAYLGPPTTLAELVLEPPHGLLRQSYAPRDMRGGGTVNADGFGVGWFPVGPTPERAREWDPVRYRAAGPIWSDVAFAALAEVTVSCAVVAAVRSATVGMPVHAGAVAPFGEGSWLFSHNGRIPGWPHSVAGLAAELPPADLLTLDAPIDAAFLWALVRHRLRAGVDPAEVLREVVASVVAAAPGARLNLLLGDGRSVHATTWTHALSVRTTPDAVLVASEPTDAEPGWAEVPDRHLVTARPGTVHVESL